MTVTVGPSRDDATAGAHHGVDGLYQRHIAGAVRLAYLMTGDRATAQDVAHDAFLKAASRLTAMRAPDRFSAYLRTAVVRQVLMRRRSESRERARMERTAPSERGPDHHQATEQRLDLFVALDRLPHRQRAVVVLRYWQDLSEADIARLLRCRVGTVKSTMSRALTALREQGAIHG